MKEEVMTENIEDATNPVIDPETLGAYLAENPPPVEEPSNEERLIAESTAFMREATEQRVRAIDAESRLLIEAARGDVAEARAAAAEAKLAALLVELSREDKGSVFAIDFKTDGAMYARETIHQRVNAAIQRARA